MIGNVVAPATVPGFAEAGAFLAFIDDKDRIAAEHAKLKAEYDRINALVATAGKIDDIERLLADAMQAKAAAEDGLQAARQRAAQMIDQANADVAKIVQAADAKLAEAKAILDEAKADAKERNAKCLKRERDAEEAEALAVTHAAEVAADRKALDAREAAVAEREATVQATILRLATAGIKVG